MSTSEFWSLDVSCFADVNIESPPSMHPCKKICDITGYEVCGSLDKMWYYRSNQCEYIVWMFDPAARGRFIYVDICILLLKFLLQLNSVLFYYLSFRSILRVEPLVPTHSLCFRSLSKPGNHRILYYCWCTFWFA